jgi:plastocyanin
MLLAVVGALVAAIAPVEATPVPVPSVALAGPGGFAVGFATPVVPMLQGGSVTFVNTDVATHNVRSRATVLKRVRSGKGYKTIRVPLFTSASIGVGETADVVGVARLKPGTYAFICSIHPNMAAQLQVQASP